MNLESYLADLRARDLLAPEFEEEKEGGDEEAGVLRSWGTFSWESTFSALIESVCSKAMEAAEGKKLSVYLRLVDHFFFAESGLMEVKAVEVIGLIITVLKLEGQGTNVEVIKTALNMLNKLISGASAFPKFSGLSMPKSSMISRGLSVMAARSDQPNTFRPAVVELVDERKGYYGVRFLDAKEGEGLVKVTRNLIQLQNKSSPTTTSFFLPPSSGPFPPTGESKRGSNSGLYTLMAMRISALSELVVPLLDLLEEGDRSLWSLTIQSFKKIVPSLEAGSMSGNQTLLGGDSRRGKNKRIKRKKRLWRHVCSLRNSDTV